MKKAIAVILVLLLVLVPQSALALQGGEVLQNGMEQPVLSPEVMPVQSEADIQAIEALLLGVDYDNKEVNVSAWSDEELGGVLYTKLLDDFFREEGGTYLEKMGIAYRNFGDSAMAVDLGLVQQLSEESFGLDFPADLDLSWIRVTGDEVVFEISSGEFGELSVQNCVRVGNTVLAVGSAVYHYGVGSEFKGHFLATLEEKPGSVYGYRLISMMPVEDSETLQNLTAEASSELVETKTTHAATNVLDNDRTTAWCEAVEGVGVGEWITLQTMDGSKMHISAIEFLMGYHKSQDHLYKNGYPWEVLIEAEGNYAQKVTFGDMDDSILLTSPVETEWLKITILDAEAGSKYEDTCITEIKLHGIDAEPCFRQHIADLPVEDATEPTEPEVTEPVATEPEETEPVATEPEETEPVATEPEETEPVATEPEETEPTSTEAEVSEPTSTDPEETEPTATEPEETETTEDKKFFWELDEEDLDEDDLRGENRKEEPEDNQTTMLLLVAVIAAAVVIVALLVVLIIVVIKKKK